VQRFLAQLLHDTLQRDIRGHFKLIAKSLEGLLCQIQKSPCNRPTCPDSSDTDDRETSDLDNTVNDISNPRAGMTTTGPPHNPRAPLVPTSSGGGVVGLHDTKRCPSFPTPKSQARDLQLHQPPRYFRAFISWHDRAFHKRESSYTRVPMRYSATSAMEVLLDPECAALFENTTSLLLPSCDALKATRHPHLSRIQGPTRHTSKFYHPAIPNGLLTHRLNRCVIDLCPKWMVSLLLASSAFVKLHLPLVISLLVLR
jgi:hypothetical protein